MWLPSVSSLWASPSPCLVERSVVITGFRNRSPLERTVVCTPGHRTGSHIKSGAEQMGLHAPLPIVPENRICLANRPKLPLGCRVIVHVRVVPFAKLMERFVNGNPQVRELG